MSNENQGRVQSAIIIRRGYTYREIGKVYPQNPEPDKCVIEKMDPI